ncbi:hypothetical protein AVEN_268130-1 [Araneus ventricosus]|uniref:Uncharacterized protein n=1 Tax=Araneus ventricosus TaxID=182803 RepID=A0A4Y2K6X7_ARAVE|nr:hypothetical protein AVEN_268130-1 [Araneus ventricosus]
MYVLGNLGSLLPSGKILVSRRRVPVSKPDSSKEPPCVRAWCKLILTSPNVLQSVWCGSLKREAPAQASSSSSDHGSKLRDPSPKNSPHVAPKRDVNISKLNKN